MDEILIEEKKYISSKRAAKITGYAKDYIGQLCREGRVPARLIGRGWYVLETAIKDHRFGNHVAEQNEDTKPTEAESHLLPVTWEAPRYQAVKDESTTSVNLLRDAEATKAIEAIIPVTDNKQEQEKDPEILQNLQNSWQPWFNPITDTEPPTTTTPEESKKSEENPPLDQTGEINVPIRTIYQLPPKELLPRNIVKEYEDNKPQIQEIQQEERGKSSILLRIIQTILILVTISTGFLAIIGSGYFDKYISNRQVMIIAGISVYNK